jgi:hypothetical protein
VKNSHESILLSRDAFHIDIDLLSRCSRTNASCVWWKGRMSRARPNGEFGKAEVHAAS